MRGRGFATVLLFLVVLSLVGSVIVLHVFYRESEFWPTDLPQNSTCEPRSSVGFVLQPFSAYFSLVYLLVGTYILCCAYFDYHTWMNEVLMYSSVRDREEADIIGDQFPLTKLASSDESGSDEGANYARTLQKIDDLDVSQSPLIQHPLMSILFGLHIIFLFVGTFLFHSCYCSWGGRLQDAAIISVTLLPIYVQLFLLLIKTNCGRFFDRIILPISLLIFGLASTLPEVLPNLPPRLHLY
eukprot:TRINITY_DN3971_c0_g1_i1.p1 TRINITY_DN3971_c0_g1~~TRINITY_DN3971_c0_g1_i1.p1  ORF type:complete len:241 (-),score=26.54 TRINITY_DN3971_c0_g1_i1:573-1295(-)